MGEQHSSNRLNMFRVAVPFCAVVAVLGLVVPEHLADGANAITHTVFRALDWLFLAITSGSLFLCIWLAFTRFGRIRLGDQEPEFSTASWLSMLFAAGMGTGLLFWGVAEPLTHYGGGLGVTAESPEAASHALVITGLHWGLHAWGVYGLAALVLAYFGFRKKTPYLPGAPIRHAFVGSWVRPAGLSADFIAIVAVAFGVAGSIAMGILQLQSGLSVVSGVDPQSLVVQGAILAVLVVCYMASASTGLDKGIKILSNINMSIAILLMVFVLVVGPTAFLLENFITLIGDYLSSLFRLSFALYPYDEGRDWMHGWTLTYFIWWIAWAPFVGVFIARISRGRTIREFVLGVLVAPTLFSLLWFSVFGGTGLYEELYGGGGIAAVVREDVTRALFALFERLPLSQLLSATSLVLVFIFLVTSVDSATFVLGMLTSKGSLDPPPIRKLGWGLSLGALGGALMLSKNVEVVKAVAITGAIPFAFILLIQAAALLRSVIAEHRPENDQ